jgi:hypothetical protein
MSDLTVADAEGVVVVPVRSFPTARPASVSAIIPEFTTDGRSRAIEFFLADGGTPETFAHEMSLGTFDVRSEAGPGVEWPGLNLELEELSGFNFRGANLTGARLGCVAGAWFQHGRLDRAIIAEAQGAKFDFADLHEAQFRSSRLEGASFSGARLGGACFTEASLRLACFTGADLSGADFTGADLTGADLDDVEAALDADFTEAEGLSDEQRRILADRGAIGVGYVRLAPLVGIRFIA